MITDAPTDPGTGSAFGFSFRASAINISSILGQSQLHWFLSV
jgi:hypothetical protein